MKVKTNIKAGISSWSVVTDWFAAKKWTNAGDSNKGNSLRVSGVPSPTNPSEKKGERHEGEDQRQGRHRA